MKHRLWRAYTGKWPIIDISPDEFLSLKTAKNNLFTMLGVEEKFDMLLQNYVEYEQAFLSLALEQITGPPSEWSEYQDLRLLVTRRLANLLTMCRQYVDQVAHDFSVMYGGDSSVAVQVEEVFREQYDRLFGYRVMDALRNYLQHRASPISGMEFPHDSLGEGEAHRLRVRVNAKIRVAELLDDPDFKKSVAKELRTLGVDSLNVTPLVRSYVEGLSRAHEKLRKLTSQDVEPWKNEILRTLRRYGDALGESNIKFVVAYAIKEDDSVAEEVEIFPEAVVHLDDLRKRRVPNYVAKHFVSSESG